MAIRCNFNIIAYHQIPVWLRLSLRGHRFELWRQDMLPRKHCSSTFHFNTVGSTFSYSPTEWWVRTCWSWRVGWNLSYAFHPLFRFCTAFTPLVANLLFICFLWEVLTLNRLVLQLAKPAQVSWEVFPLTDLCKLADQNRVGLVWSGVLKEAGAKTNSFRQRVKRDTE